MADPADIVLKNGKVFTADLHHPWANAVALRGNEIIAVGTDEEIAVLIDTHTQCIDLEGKVVLPGFNDAHTHYISAALDEASTFSLFGVTTLQEAGERITAFSRKYPTLEWLHGVRLDLGRFEQGRFPDRLMLDQFEHQRPVAISDIDGHSCWVNSCALEVLGYKANTADPVGGQIVRSADGTPVGLLFEAAAEPIPEPALPPGLDFRQVILEGGERLNRLGITSLSNNGILPEHLDTLLEMAHEGSLAFRVNEWLALTGDLAPAMHQRQRLQGNEMVQMVGLKTFIDGVLSSRTAWLLEPYTDDPGHTGFPMLDVGDLRTLVVNADKAGFQVITHAIGDRGVREILDIYQQAMETNGKRDSRHRVEHVEMSHPQDQPRFSQLGVIPCMQPLHCTACIDDYTVDRIGEVRSSYSYTWKTFLDTGAHLCFGTDWPAIDMKQPNPLENIYGAVTRKHPFQNAKTSWHPEQCLTLGQAIRCYTLEPAYAEFMETRKGSITPGKLADLCVLDRDIFTQDPQGLLETGVVMTIFNGRIAFRNF